MQILWFYIAVALAISDIIHSKLMWGLFFDFYIVLAGIIQTSLSSKVHVWLVHEVLEAIFHFIIISVVFLSPVIGLTAGLVHFVIDVSHTVAFPDIGEVEHRCLHFVIESLCFMLFFGV